LASAQKLQREPVLGLAWIGCGLVTLAYALLLAARGGPALVAQAAGLALASQPLGKFVVFAAWHAHVPFGIWELALIALLWDVHVCFLLAWTIGLARRAGRVGAWMDARHAQAESALASYPGLRRLAFVGLVLFIVLPAGTGPVLGTFVARLLGFSRLNGALAVGAGSAVTTAIFAAVAQALGSEGERLLKNPWLAATLTLILGGLLAAGWFAARRVLRATDPAAGKPPRSPGLH
jgi:Putative small multi-drug export protein